MDKIKVMHIIDSLELGGAEKVAINIVNFLPRQNYIPHICITRKKGPLIKELAQDVNCLFLGKKSALGVKAIYKLVKYIKMNNIQILHAHGLSLFMAAIVDLFCPYLKIIWHDHYGLCEFKNRFILLYRFLARRTNGIIVVNKQLLAWQILKIKANPKKVWNIPNFLPIVASTGSSDIMKKKDKQLVCVANFRREKGHFTLINAMKLVVREFPNTKLYLIGKKVDNKYFEEIQVLIRKNNLQNNIIYLGEKENIFEILLEFKIGILSSISEGFPLALLEYGLAGLAVIATDVGACREILNEGKAGILVPPSSPKKLAEAIIFLLVHPEKQKIFGENLYNRVKNFYNPTVVIEQICRVYENLFKER